MKYVDILGCRMRSQHGALIHRAAEGMTHWSERQQDETQSPSSQIGTLVISSENHSSATLSQCCDFKKSPGFELVWPFSPESDPLAAMTSQRIWWLPSRALRSVFFLTPGLAGCTADSRLILQAQGPVAQSQHDLLALATGIMLLVVLPVIVMALLFAWRYRASSRTARYDPQWSAPRYIEILVWVVPFLIVVALGMLVWVYSHRLDPYRPIQGNATPLEIQAIALDWKWLFIYPSENIATVNELALPAGRPVTLKITSGTVMNSMFIPALAGQIYAMAGMQTQLNLRADQPGLMIGRNAQFSGSGFPEQTFPVEVMTGEAFTNWISKVRSSSNPLDEKVYATLARPTVKAPIEYYGTVKPALFEDLVMRYMPEGSVR